MSTNLDLKALVYSSKTHFATMRQYDRFFASLFGAELVNFGYERLNKNGFYEGISSIPQIADIFAETMAYQVMHEVTEQLFSVEHGFIYLNSVSDQSLYNKFRIQLDKQLDIHSTFYAIEPCLNYQHIFVWNFRAPLKPISLTTWENQILLSFINHKKSIQYVLSQFKKVYTQMRTKSAPIKLLKLATEENKTSQVTVEKRLLESKWLTKSDLNLKNIDFSNKEASCIYFYLQGMNAREIGKKMFISTRTVEDHIKHIKQKLFVNSRSEFYLAMKKVNLWRNTL
ncbi:MAG TPA: helix-turn-helix domain-containing protein [Gammaproteobacteria bacterium]|nr:helix-turn-helix domain-containing protein [Gammaproteobacteria bacterium]HRA43361.1 helix-turn-helix domain-containing protein [Gammaproteobacteria bacterium]